MAGGTPSARSVNGRDRVAITVRVPEALLRRIDRFIEGRDVPISRNNWLLEAAVEKLDRQGMQGRERDGT